MRLGKIPQPETLKQQVWGRREGDREETFGRVITLNRELADGAESWKYGNESGQWNGAGGVIIPLQWRRGG